MKFSRPRPALPSPAMVVALLALVIAMSGTAWAASKVTGADIKNNTVTTKDVKNNSLTGKDVKNNSLTGKDVKNESLTGKDVKNGSLTGNEVSNESLTGEDVKDRSLSSSDLSPDAQGSRAVAALYGTSADGGSCTVLTSKSRGIASTCTRNAAGVYRVDLLSSVSASGTSPVCSVGGNGGFSETWVRTCGSDLLGSDTLRVVVGVWSGTTHTPTDAARTVPVVIVLP